jgi:hypothetical protein
VVFAVIAVLIQVTPGLMHGSAALPGTNPKKKETSNKNNVVKTAPKRKRYDLVWAIADSFLLMNDAMDDHMRVPPGLIVLFLILRTVK